MALSNPPRLRPGLHLPLPFNRASGLKGLIGILSNETTLVIALVVFGALVHSLNMFNYPAFTYKDDEGIYTSQAWSVLQLHKVTPYTYTFDHTPLGWIQYAVWTGLTGGFYAFGTPINSGRVLMLLLHLLMIPMLYQLARKLGGNIWMAVLATFLFSISPLAIFYQRLVLLDNIMLFWVLLSLNLLLDGKGRLSRLFLSGVCFGLGLLSKETAIFLLPVVLYLAWRQRWHHHGRFGFTAWVVPAAMVVSLYPLYALFKGELLPASQNARFYLGGNPVNGVSLVDGLRWQSTRGDGGIFNLDNEFWKLISSDWMVRDGWLFAGGVIATMVNILRGLRNRLVLVTGLLGLLPLIYLARGGVVFSYYIVFAIPFFCLNLAVLLSPLFNRLPGTVAWILTAITMLVCLAGYTLGGTLPPLFTENPSEPGNSAVAWIKQNIDPNSKIVIRDDMWTELHQAQRSGPVFQNAHSHWKVGADPAIRLDVFNDDWHNVDYLVMSGGLEGAFAVTNNTVALDALTHAYLVKRWAAPAGNTALHPAQFVEIWKVDKTEAIQNTLPQVLMARSASYMSGAFEKDGAFYNSNGAVTSENQAFALLRAVWSGDRSGFESAWNWTRANLLNENGLLRSEWRPGLGPTDNRNLSGPDSDAALALLMASKRWNNPALLEAGKQMVTAIWNYDVVTINDNSYLTAGAWAAKGPQLILRPAYFAPYAYHIFQEVVPEYPWQALIATGYQVLFDSTSADLGFTHTAGLPPEWIGLNRSTEELQPLTTVAPGFDGKTPSDFGPGAAATYWRVALDKLWNKDGRAITFLEQATFFQDEVTASDGFVGIHAHDGTIIQNKPDLASTAGAMAALQALDPVDTNLLYGGQLVSGFNSTRDGSGIWWGDQNDLQAQEWGWFATALYHQALSDLWHYRPQDLKQAKLQ
ncbi:MAG TPA: glycosyl hydrolase family 8 [Chloroflexia bacterium]|nr:glycosyl hydrolase family 8 [Chloroflexia bacterium]